MQYHIDGFRPGDPDLHPAAPGRPRRELPGRLDVLIVGAGPAGLTLAAQLARFPQIETRIVERKPGPMEKGQADGISCRSMEMFAAFGFADRVMREGYHVNETVFWTPAAGRSGGIARAGRVRDVADGLSEMPHVILNQARVHDAFLALMRNAPARLVPDYGLEVVDLTVDRGAADHPVHVALRPSESAPNAARIALRARYVVGCDGARSTVRQAIGRKLSGDAMNQAWGVMDVLAVTDFPDIRFKALIQSAAGNMLVIPREGGYLVRLYIELDKLAPGERVAGRAIGIDALIAAAGRILRPYRLDVREVVWWSVYEIGQRLTDRFDDRPGAAADAPPPRVFIAGDACHTHSPKAGQGMNVSMGDGFNLGWKLAQVLTGRAPESVLDSYSAERQEVARALIDFDREWARSVGNRPDPAAEGVPPLQRHFVESGPYTAGLSVTYAPSLLTGPADHRHLAPGFPVGARFHSAPVLRLADAYPMELGRAIEADGRWRVFAFCPDEDPGTPEAAIAVLCAFLDADADSPIRRATPAGADADAAIDVRAVFQCGPRDLAPDRLPGFVLPRKGRLGLIDYEKAFCADTAPGRDIFDLRAIDRAQGCLVIVRPDQHVAHVLPFGAHADLAAFFSRVLLPAG
jgi:phenol 2-monooxygenase